MSDETSEPKKKSKAMLFGILGALLLGGAGGFATYSGMVTLPFGGGGPSKEETADINEGVETAYVRLDPLIVDLGRGGRSGRLRLSLIVETTTTDYSAVEGRKYRIADTLNSFLRAVKQDDLRDPSRTDMLRSRILRRVLLETPPGTVSDVLISEFVVL